jgi:NAD(P)-dependent dehydrogenase (short-subunit alcohol dehydrogenase family)
VAVVIGVGGMGCAVAERIGPGTHLLIADFNESTLHAVANQLRDRGHQVSATPVDASSRESVTALARRAAELGDVRYVVHTAGLGPVQAPTPTLLAVNLLGVALVIERFGKVITPGGAGVVIASTAAHRLSFSPEQALQLATTPADELLALPIAAAENFPNALAAYSFTKRANLVRVQAASVEWGAKGARINTISPGIVATPMAEVELSGEHGAAMRALLDGSNAQRMGTPADIAAAADFLLGTTAGFISGADLLVDGGATAAVRVGHISAVV